MSIAFVCFMGIATVFVGLIALILITGIMSSVCKRVAVPEAAVSTAQTKSPAKDSTAIPNKQEIIAGACALIAEELGEDVKNIRVTSFKKL